MNTGIIIQARSSSTRLPGKILKELPYASGITILQQVIRRCLGAGKADVVIVATTDQKEDEQIVKLARKEGVDAVRGSVDNVLERFYVTAGKYNLKNVIRVTSDCPCIDPLVIDDMLENYAKNKYDYLSNISKRTYPHGLDVEVFSFDTLKEAHENAKEKYELEHVTPYIYKSNLSKFNVGSYTMKDEEDYSDLRVTIDRPEDYAMLCVVYDYLYKKDKMFRLDDLINLYKRKPWIKLINSAVIQKQIHGSIEEEYEAAIKLLKMQEMNNVAKVLQDARNNS